MKQYSNLSINQFFNQNEEQIKLPLTSLETYNTLVMGTTLNEISDVVDNFNLLVDKDKSVLKNIHQTNELVNNQAFINELNDIVNRLSQAIENKKPYRLLFGDVVRLKELLEVVSGYYRDQLQKSLPDLQAYIREVLKPSSSFLTLLSSIVHNQKLALDDIDSEILEKFILIHNTDPRSIMEKDIATISKVLLMSFLEDHGNNTACYYQK